MIKKAYQKSKKAIILGAGVAGLSTGWKLAEAGYQTVVLEKNLFIGGMASTFKYQDMYLDYGPHKIFTLMEDVLVEIKDLIGEKDLLKVKKKSRIYLKGQFLNYPLILSDLLYRLGLKTCIDCGLSYLTAEIKSIFRKTADYSFADWVSNRFGTRLYELIFAPYARKIWGEPKNLAVELASTRIAVPSLWEIIRQMILKLPEKSVINAPYFYYPKTGVGQISVKMADKISNKNGQIVIDKTVSGIKLISGKVRRIEYGKMQKIDIDPTDVIVSTIPIPILLKILDPVPPEAVFNQAMKLKTRNLILFYLVLSKSSVSSDSWLFFPEEKFAFNRVFEQKNFSKFMIPENKTVLCLEITCDSKSPTWRKTTDQLYKVVITQLKETGLIKPNQVVDYFDKRLSFAYPIYDISFRRNLDYILDWINNIDNLYTVGRQGAFGYTGTLDSIHMGFTVANYIKSYQNKSGWKRESKKFKSYVVVD